ncbi:alanine:cation symporter family protein [Peribacillus frigoritolerans]|nr:alanine:cation symporter family protein [Peribacillus frigoritolerans]
MENAEPSVYTQLAVDSALPQFGAGFLAVSLFFFCFTTLLSYYYKAETNLAFSDKKPKYKVLDGQTMS